MIRPEVSQTFSRPLVKRISGFEFVPVKRRQKPPKSAKNRYREVTRKSMGTRVDYSLFLKKNKDRKPQNRKSGEKNIDFRAFGPKPVIDDLLGRPFPHNRPGGNKDFRKKI